MIRHVTLAFEDNVNDAPAPLTATVTAFSHFCGDVDRANVHRFGKASCDRPMTATAQFRRVDRVADGGPTGRQSDPTVTGFHGHDHGAHVEVNGLLAHEDLAFVHGPMTTIL